MEAYYVFKDLAIIIIFAKFFGILARKLKAPQVVGEIIAGLLIGPSILGLVQQSDFLLDMAEIGVVLLMFSAGLETNLKELLKTGPKALLIACAGVFVPLIGGALLYMGFYGMAPWGSENFYKAVFMGVILTATSVSITVETLKEMGKLKGKVGTTILSAAIIDDVIGIIVLTFVIGFKNPDSNPGKVVLNTALFFVFAIVVGLLIYKLIKFLDNKYPHTRRIPIIGLSLPCFCLYCRAVFWHSGYHRRLCSRYYSLLHQGFGIYSRKDGYQFLHDIRSGIFCQHRAENKLEQYDRRPPAFLPVFCPCGTYHQDYGLRADVQILRL